jgi:hypothetical protein
MKEKDIPVEVVRFIYENIRVYQDLQALILIFRNQEEDYSFQELAKEYKFQVKLAEEVFLRLYSLNFLLKRKRGLEWYYSYNPTNRNDYVITEFLDTLFDERQIELMILILSQPYCEPKQNFTL